MKTRLFLLLVSALSAGIAHADIFRYVDADGMVHFTNVPNDSRYKVYLKEKKKPDPVTDTLASEIREALGDTKARGQRTADAETFTATSLDAMAAYARGQELNYAGRQTDALKAFQEAVTLDPGLARAYSGMGVIYGALKQDAKVEESYQNALQHLDRMTEREKFRTLGGYYLLVTHNYEKAIENYVALVASTPRTSPAMPISRTPI